MKIDGRSLCVFLDGIDEMHPNDGINDLLKLMDQWRHIHNGPMKFCLASRPEQPIRRRLESCPHLRLEDLTANDLKQFAESQLEFLKNDTTYKELDEDYDLSIASLVQKAEVVFIWLCLAIKDLKRGFANDDEPLYLQRRIERLHGDIESLYEDMWSRMNGDEEIYRESTALYLKLLITARGMFIVDGVARNSITVFDMLLCSSGIADEVLDARSDFQSISTDKLLADCKKTEQQVQTKCAGLLESFEVEDTPKVKVTDWGGGEYVCLSEYISKKGFRFIHRTAFDFLVDTVNGQKIINHNNTSEMA